MRKPLLSRGPSVFVAACLVCLFAFPLSAQQGNSTNGRAPLVQDWSSRHIVFSKPANNWQAIVNQSDPRFWQQYYRRNQGKLASSNRGLGIFGRLFQQRRGTQKDWAVSLGAGGVAQGMYPAKYSFNANAAPNCANDFAVFPINAPTGNTRANLVGTFTAEPGSGQTLLITITPTVGTVGNLTLTAGATNTGTNFAISATTATDATNLAAAINRNLSNTALDRIVAVASGSKVTVYALTPGSRVVLTDTNGLTGFTGVAITAGTNGAQASIVAFNQLYSGTAPFCAGLTFPEFIFSYASGVGPVATSPTLSLDGTKVAYVENDPNIGAILHVLTYATGATEYGVCTNSGVAAPTCATNPVIPGSAAGSTATDFMLPLGLVAANAATAVVGALDSFSSPFMHYGFDTLYVGDNNGYLYSIYPTFTATPAFAGGNFPLQLNTTASSTPPTAVTATAGAPGTVTVTVANTLAALQSVTISGVTANGANCSAADAAAINGGQIVATAAVGNFTFNATIPTTTTGAGCTITNANVSPGTNILSAPAEDTGSTANIFVGDSSGNLYMVTPAGVVKQTLSVGANINGGVRAGPMIDSGNVTGFAVTACDNSGTLTGGEADTTNAALWQFTFTATTMTKGVGAELDTAANEGCSLPGYPTYDPTPDERYLDLGISNAAVANNGEIIAAASGSGGEQLKIFQFVISALQTVPLAKPQFEAVGPSPMSPLTEFYNPISGAFTVTAATVNAAVATITAANTLAANDLVTVSGVTINGGRCVAADVTAINAALQTVATATATQFTFAVPAGTPNTTGSGCTHTGATATGGPDYMFVGVEQNSPGVYSFLMPGGVVANTQAVPANTADAAGGTSGMVVDNNGTGGQESSLYYGTLATSTTICGAAAAYCAIKLTQSGLN